MDEEHAALPVGGLGAVDDEDARRDPGAVEEVGREAEDGFDDVVFRQPLADPPLGAAAEEDAVGEDDAEHAARGEGGDDAAAELAHASPPSTHSRPFPPFPRPARAASFPDSARMPPGLRRPGGG